MKTTTHSRRLLLALCTASIVVHSASAQTITFFDDFEGPTLDSFWSTNLQNGGTFSISTAKAFSGTHSLQSTTLNNGLNHDSQLFHDFGVPVYGTFSLRVFDTIADILSGNYLQVYTTDPGGNGFQLFTQDFDLGPNTGGNYYYNTLATGSVNTPIDRTQDWHLFSVTVEQNFTSMSIDGQQVYSGPGTTPFTQVVFDQHAPGFRPGVTSYIDTAQVTVHVVPEPGAAALLGMALLGFSICGRSQARRAQAS